MLLPFVAFSVVLQQTLSCLPTPAGSPVEEVVGLVILPHIAGVDHPRGLERLHPAFQIILDTIVTMAGAPQVAPLVPIETATEFYRPSDPRLAKLDVPVPPIGVRVMLNRPGTLADRNDHVRTANPLLNRQLLTAFRAALAPAEIKHLLDLAQTDSLELSLITVLRTGRQESGPTASWFKQQLPVYESRPVSRIDRDPDMKKFYGTFGADVKGWVLVQYVVGPDGVPALGTLRFLRREGEGQLELGARYLLSHQRYQPATLGGCPWSQLMQQRLTFGPPKTLSKPERRPRP